MPMKEQVKTAAVYETLAAFGFTKKADDALGDAVASTLLGSGIVGLGGYYLGRQEVPKNEAAAKKQQYILDMLPIYGFGPGGVGYNFGKRRAARDYLEGLNKDKGAGA